MQSDDSMHLKRLEPRRAAKSLVLNTLLVVAAIFGPLVAYAAVTVIWPPSTQTTDINASPPVTFSDGADGLQARNLGFAGTFTATNSGASYTVTLSGLSGGEVEIDEFIAITKGASVTSYKIKVDTALTGTLTTPTTLKLRLWTGATAPSADADAQVCAVLDLKAAGGTESTAACTATSKMQLVYRLPDASTGSSTVKILPSSIVFA